MAAGPGWRLVRCHAVSSQVSHRPNSCQMLSIGYFHTASRPAATTSRTSFTEVRVHGSESGTAPRPPADRLQPRQGGRAARRLAELGGCRSRQREIARARSSVTAGARGNETHLRTSESGGRNGLSLSIGLCQATWQYPELSRRPVQVPPPDRTDCGPGGRRGTIAYHVSDLALARYTLPRGSISPRRNIHFESIYPSDPP
jgi:hypothetical protein